METKRAAVPVEEAIRAVKSGRLIIIVDDASTDETASYLEALALGSRDVREHVHLATVERAIGDRDAQHIGVEL